MKQMELFAGIGGFGLAGEWAGIESAVQVEWNPFCQKVLKKNFPNAIQYGDITTFDGAPYRGTIDIISGGFPCQPYSTAGKRLGKEDDRHLWPQMLRIIQEVAPRWVVGENVRGIISWNGGMVFDEVQADLEASGYEVQAFLLPACGVNAPHRRERVWFVAFNSELSTNGRHNTGTSEGKGVDMEGNVMVSPGREQGTDNLGASNCYAPNADSRQCKERGKVNGKRTNETEGCAGMDNRASRLSLNMAASEPDNRIGGNFNRFPTQPPVCGRNDGVSNRVDRIAALGNAIVPQIAFQIFKAIKEYEI